MTLFTHTILVYPSPSHTSTHTYSLSLSHSLSHTHTHTHTYSLSLSLSLSLTHTHTHTQMHTLTHSPKHIIRSETRSTLIILTLLTQPSSSIIFRYESSHFTLFTSLDSRYWHISIGATHNLCTSHPILLSVLDLTLFTLFPYPHRPLRLSFLGMSHLILLSLLHFTLCTAYFYSHSPLRLSS